MILGILAVNQSLLCSDVDRADVTHVSHIMLLFTFTFTTFTKGNVSKRFPARKLGK